MNTIAQQLSHVSTWWTSLSMVLSPVEAGALALAVIALAVAAATYRRPVVTLNERSVRDAGLTVEEARR